MKTYIGTKIIRAESATRGEVSEMQREAAKNEDRAVKAVSADAPGYIVIYEDGYVSWSPKDVFEQAYRPADGLPFGMAIEMMKRGKHLARQGWNGKNQHIELATNISYTPMGGAVVNAEHDAIGSQAIAFVGTSGVQMGWLASQADMLAEDWIVVE